MRERNLQLKIYLSKNELTELEKKSKKFNSKSEFIRQLILNNDENLLHEKNENLLQVKRELKAIGNNLNQLARYANTDKKLEIRELEGGLIKLWQLLKRAGVAVQ